MSGLLPSHLEGVRLRVIDRMAALLESQTQSKIFGGNLNALVKDVHTEVIADLRGMTEDSGTPELAERLERAVQTCERLDATLDLLIDERQRQWHRNGNYVQATMQEFNATLTDLASTLVEKDLLERQSKVLERDRKSVV